MRFRRINIVFVLIAFFQMQSSYSQDLEPRLLSAIPTGGNFAIASYGYSSGNILVDSTLPIEDLNARLNNFVLAWARSFKLFNRLAKVDVIAPYSLGNFEGIVNSVDPSTTRAGFGDPLVRFSMVLIGSGPFRVKDFFKQEQKKFNLGIFVRVRPPLGQYNPEKLINLGANRWAVKLGVAGSYVLLKKIIFEGHLNTWVFTENKDFFNGNSIKQKPLISAQIHVSYIFKPGIWLAASVGRSGMGETLINGIEKNDKQKNSRFGAAFAYRISKNHALKIAYTSGISTRYGANFNTIMLAYQFMWFDKGSIN
jgi:hypothetical protein